MRSLSRFAVFTALALSIGISHTAFAETAGQYIDDATITTKIKAAIATDTVLKKTDITVTTNQGVVKVGGIVHSREQADEVVNLANHVDGVKSVTDATQIQPMPKE